MKNAYHLATCSLIICSTFTSTAQAETWDATDNFTALTTSNPNGAWSYGYDPAATNGYQFKAFDQLTNSGGYSISWLDSTYQLSATPTFGKNLSGLAQNGLPPGQIALHPGPTPDDDAAILRFTAPDSSLYRIDANFYAGDMSETDAWIVRNGDFANPLSSLGVTSVNPSYVAPSLFLGAGDTLDFVVGNHGSFYNDTTPLSVHIVSVPEPGTFLLALGGLVALIFNLRTSRRPEA